MGATANNIRAGGAFVELTADDAQLHAALNKAAGYPSKGVNVGRGPHVEIPDEPTAENSTGWTTELTSLVRTKEGFGVVVTDRVEELQGKAETIEGQRVTIDVSGAVEKEVVDERPDSGNRRNAG
jgi:hypothetical protein